MAEFTVTIRDIPGEKRASVYFSNVHGMWPMSTDSTKNTPAQHAFILFNLRYLESMGLRIDAGELNGQ